MWPAGQVWKPGPAYPATVAASPPATSFRIRIYCSRGSLTPVAAPNASPNVILAWGPDAKKRFRSHCLEGCGPKAKCGNRGQRTRLQWRLCRVRRRFRIRIFCSRGSLTPVAAPNVWPNVFFAWGRLRRSGFGAIVLRDVARRPSVETGANVPGYSGGVAACAVGFVSGSFVAVGR